VAGPVVGDIMVFGAPSCSAGRKKWRHGAFLGLLPAPVGGESDITELYVARYGEPEPGKRVFIHTRQQKEGWAGWNKDSSELVPVRPLAARPRGGQIRSPKAEIRPAATARQRGERKPEIRGPNAARLGGRLRSPGRVVEARCTREHYRILHRSITVAIPLEHGEGRQNAGCEVQNADCR
jgi:hypothetical protein